MRKKSLGKRILIIVAALLLLTITVSAAVLHYDYNGDGQIGSRDAVYLLKHLTDPEGYPLNPPADANGDGTVNDADAIYLLRHSLDPERYPLYTDHTPEIIPSQAATCTTNGFTEGVRCKDCETVLTEQEVIPPLGHDPDESVWLSDATGHWRNCRRTICEDQVNAAEHTYTEWLPVEAGGCSLEAYHIRACLTCGYCETDLPDTVLHAHQWAMEDLAPTCTEPGYRHRVYCVNCDTEAHKIIEPALDHDWEGAQWMITPTTHSRTCQREDCGYIEKDNHELGYQIIEREATCTEEGSCYRECNICKERFYEPILPKHDLVYTEAKNPTCTNDGHNAYESCKLCDYTTFQLEPALGHLIDEDNYTTDKDYHWKPCGRDNCQYIESKDHHSFGPWETVQIKTCTKDGINKRTCTVCQYEETETIKAGHNYDLENWVTDANSHWHPCIDCNKRIDIANHKPASWTVTVEPTCETQGKEVSTCQICEAYLERTITVTHDYNGAPWSSDATEHWHNCIRPGCTSRIDVAQHSWGDWITDAPAACETEGFKHRVCTVCNYTQTQIIPVLGHSYYTAPWQFDEMNHWKVCIRDNCDHIEHLAPHSFGSWKVRTPSTCTEAGEEYRVCFCGYEEARALTIPGHDLSGKFLLNETGHWKECQRTGCSYSTKEEAHTYGSWEILRAETCTQNGLKEHSCTVCGYTEEAVIDEIDGHLGSQWFFNDTYHYKHCDRCQEDYNRKSHSWEETFFPATCTTGAYTLKFCEVCKHEIKIWDSDPLGHHWIADHDQQDHWEYCDRPDCGETKPKEPHSMGFWNTVTAADCITGGEEASSCYGCSYTTTRATDPLGHNFTGSWIDYNSEQHYQKCERCNERDYKEHRWTVSKVVPSECEKSGYTEYKCSDCGRTEKRDYQDPTGHTDGQNDTNWYTENPDSHWLTCIICGKDYKMGPHNWSDWSCDVQADCENPGNEYRTCSICNRREDKSIPAKGHDNSGNWIQGEITHYKICQRDNCDKILDENAHVKGTALHNETHHWYTCTICKKTPVYKETHSYGAWETETPATCTAEGLQKRYCTVCDRADSQTNILPIIPHDLYMTVDTRAVQQTGEIVYEHTVVEKCRYGCDYYVTIGETVIHIHNEVDTIITPATCTEDGSVVVKCKVPGCEEVFLSCELPALGHDFVDGICIRCGLGTSQGLYFRLSADKTYYIVYDSGTCTDTNLIIPPTHEGLPVKEIAERAFCNRKFTSVYIPDSIITIGEDAFSSCDSLSKVMIGNGVIDIGRSAFYGCTQLTDVYFGKNVTYIGRSAFGDCINLKNTPIPDSVTTIDAYAFSWCKSLTEIPIGNGVTTIGEGAFQNCNGFIDITIPDSVITIGDSVFTNCVNLTKIVIPNSVTTLGNSIFVSCTNLKDVTIGANVTGIGNFAFLNCGNLTNITIPDSVITIGSSAFYACSNLRTLTIGKNVASIDNHVLYNCSRLETIYYVGSSKQWNQIQKNDAWDQSCTYTLICLGDPKPSEGLNFTLSTDETYYIVSGLGNCKDTTIVIPDTHEGLPVKEVGNAAFSKKTAITEVVIPDSITLIAANAFNGCTGLKDLTLGKGLKTLQQYAFRGCSGLENIYFNATAMADLSANNNVFYDNYYGSSKIHLYVGANVTRIPAYLFHPYSSGYSPKITNVSFAANSVCIRIGKNAFAYNSNLESITLPDRVTEIGEYAFIGCGKLKNFVLGKNIKKIGQYAFQSCASLPEITIPRGITTLETGTFYSCTGLKTVTFAQNTVCTSIGSSAFYGCSSLENITIPDCVTTIGANAFRECSGLKNVTIGDGVTDIGSYAFQNCTTMQTLTIGKSVTTVRNTAFSNCTGLETINFNATNMTHLYAQNNVFTNAGQNAGGITLNIGSDVTVIPAYLFCPYNSAYIPKITEIVFPENSICSTIGVSAFYNNTNPQSITIPQSVDTISTYAFYNWTNLKTIYYLGTRTQWDQINKKTDWDKNSSYELICLGDVNGSQGLDFDISDDGTYYILTGIGSCQDTDIVIPKMYEGLPVKAIGNSAFAWNESIVAVEIPDSILSIGDGAFYQCTSLYELVIPDSVQVLGSLVCDGCTRLSKVVIGNNVNQIKEQAFMDCDSLQEIKIPDSVQSIARLAFYRCYGLKTVTMGKGLKSVAERAFEECTAITTVKITDINAWSAANFDWNYGNPLCFGGALYLNDTVASTITITGIDKIGNYAFIGCTSLAKVTIGNDVTVIGDAAFYGCLNLQIVTIGNGVTTIGIDAFSECLALKTVNVGSGLKKIDHTAFYGCEKLSKFDFPEGLQTIGYAVFAGAPNIQPIILPASITAIGGYAFCDPEPEELATIYFKGSASQWAAIELDTDAYFYVKYYSETRPSSNPSNYWHYVNGVPTVWA